LTDCIFRVLYQKGYFDRNVVGIRGKVRQVEGGYGLFIEGIIPNSPAAKVLQAGDRVLVMDGSSLFSSCEKEVRESYHRIQGPEGSMVTLRIARDRIEKEYQIARVKTRYDKVLST